MSVEPLVKVAGKKKPGRNAKKVNKPTKTEIDDAKRNQIDYELFLQDLEDNPEMRQQIHLYKDLEGE